MQVLASQSHFLPNRNNGLAIPPLFWPVNCIIIGGHVALLSYLTVHSPYCAMGPSNPNQEVEMSAVLDRALNLSHHFSVLLHEEDKIVDNSSEHDAAEQLMQLSQIPLNEQK